MEVKYDDYLPDIVNRTLLTVKTKEQAFSKYAACRHHVLMGSKRKENRHETEICSINTSDEDKIGENGR